MGAVYFFGKNKNKDCVVLGTSFYTYYVYILNTAQK